MTLSGKTALVTGATGGIGRAIVEQLLAQGANVVISGTNQERLDALKGELGDNVQAFACNLSDRESIKELAKNAEGAFGSVDILVNNAGITRDNLTMRMSDDEWDDVITTNLTASFTLIRALMRGMMKRRSGRIINIGSVVGTTGNPGQANYVASKAGMVGMSKAIALEVASRGITANVIAPGFIRTAMTEKLTDDQKNAILNNIPMAEMGTPEDIAGAVVFLASDAARYMTGQTLHINGGMAMV